MRLVKLYGPAAAVALLAMALLGPATATAESTALCKLDQDPCPEANRVQALHYVADDMEISTAGAEYDYGCDALIEGVALALAAPQVIHANIAYFSCSGSCTRSEISSGFSLYLLRTGTESAELVGEGLEVQVKCGSVINCVYDLEGIVGQVSGPLPAGENGQIAYAEAPLHAVSGLLCPSEARLTALFKPLAALYIAS
jgi:hypothetical protein